MYVQAADPRGGSCAPNKALCVRSSAVYLLNHAARFCARFLPKAVAAGSETAHIHSAMGQTAAPKKPMYCRPCVAADVPDTFQQRGVIFEDFLFGVRYIDIASFSWVPSGGSSNSVLLLCFGGAVTFLYNTIPGPYVVSTFQHRAPYSGESRSKVVVVVVVPLGCHARLWCDDYIVRGAPHLITPRNPYLDVPNRETNRDDNLELVIISA